MNNDPVIKRTKMKGKLNKRKEKKVLKFVLHIKNYLRN